MTCLPTLDADGNAQTVEPGRDPDHSWWKDDGTTALAGREHVRQGLVWHWHGQWQRVAEGG